MANNLVPRSNGANDLGSSSKRWGTSYASLGSFGGSDDVVSLGPEKVTNGSFASDTDWTKGTGWSISGTAIKTAGVASDLEQSVSAVNGEIYLVSALIRTTTAGILTVEIGGVSATAIGTSADVSATIYSWVVTATGTGNLKFKANSAWAGTLDDASAKKILAYAPTILELDGASTTQIEIRSGKEDNNSLFIGLDSGRVVTTASNIIGIGTNTFKNLTVGDNSIAIGPNTLSSAGNTTRSIAIGTSAMQNATRVADCVAVGPQVMANMLTGLNNTAVGSYALNLTTASSNNTAVGVNALRYATTGSNNTTLGTSALINVTTGGANVGVGASALGSLTSGSSNVSIGTNSAAFIGTASYITAIGESAARYNTNGYVATVGAYSGGGATRVTINISSVSDNGSGKARFTTTTPHSLASSETVNITATGYTGQNVVTAIIDPYTFETAQNYINSQTGTLYSLAATSCVAVGYNAATKVTAAVGVYVGNYAGASCRNTQASTFVGGDVGRYKVSGADDTLIGYAVVGTQRVTGTISSVADNGSGKARFTTSVAHALFTGESVAIDGTVDYNTDYVAVTVIDTVRFDTNLNFTQTKTGTFGTVATNNGNVAVGRSAFICPTTAQYNTLVGLSAGTALSRGNYNVAIGRNSLYNAQSTAYCIAIGASALGITRTATIASAADNTGTVRFATSGAHGLVAGEYVNITGTTNYNGLNAISNVSDSTHFDTVQPYVSSQAGTATIVLTANGSTAVGYQAGGLISTASSCTLMGYNCGDSITMGGYNTAMGYDALGACTTGTDNVALGYAALDTITTSSYSTAVGSSALSSATGSSNTAVGYFAGGSVNTGNNNTLVGLMSGQAITTGTFNTIIGSSTGTKIVTPTAATLVGAGAASFLMSGDAAVALGAYSLAALQKTGSIASVATNGGLARFTTGSAHGLVTGETVRIAGTTSYNGDVLVTVVDGTRFDTSQSYVSSQTGTFGTISTSSGTTAVGYYAGARLTSGANTVLVGYQAGMNVTSGVNNTSVGCISMAACTTGGGNTAVGYAALDALTASNYCTAIGSNALTAATGGGNTAIGYSCSAALTSAVSTVAVGDNANGGNGSNCVAVGSYALSGSAGNDCTAVGASSGRTISGATRSTSLGFGTLGGAFRQVSFTSVADNGSGKARFNTGTAHTYVTGDTIRILSSANYNGDVAVTAVSDSTHFDTAQTFSVTNTGTSYSLTTGADNICVGAYSQRWISSAAQNTSVGSYSANALRTGLNNTAVGYQALYSCTTGQRNVAIGHQALYNASGTSNGNVAVGLSALANVTTDNNVAVGDYAGPNLTSGSGSVFVGRSAGFSVTTTSENTAIGFGAFGGAYRIQSASISAVSDNGSGKARFTTATTTLVTGETVSILGTTDYNGFQVATVIDPTHFDTSQTYVSSQTGTFSTPTTGTANTALGYYALKVATSGNNNIAIGRCALLSVGPGSQNIAIGRIALNANIEGNNNTVVGHVAGELVTGGYNTLIGSGSGGTITSGTYNVCLGFDADCSATLTNAIAIGKNAIVTASNSACIGGTSGNAINVGVGITAPTARMHLPAGTATAGTAALKIDSGTVLTSVENGAIENDGTHLYFSSGGARHQLDRQPDGAKTFVSKAFANTPYAASANELIAYTVVGGNSVVTLPAAATCPGEEIIVKRTSATAYTLTIQANGAELIDAANTFLLPNQYDALHIISTGTGWFII